MLFVCLMICYCLCCLFIVCLFISSFLSSGIDTVKLMIREDNDDGVNSLNDNDNDVYDKGEWTSMVCDVVDDITLSLSLSL